MCNWMHKARSPPKGEFKREVEKELTGGNRNRGRLSTSSCRRPDSGGRAGVRNHLLTNLRNYVFPLVQGDSIYALKCENISHAG